MADYENFELTEIDFTAEEMAALIAELGLPQDED